MPILVRELVDWLNRERDIHAVLVSGIAQFQLVHIHPFLEGSGRASRLLATLCLYRAELSERQAAALGHVIEHGRLTIHDYEKLCPEANRRTLQRDLRVLVGKGLLVEAGTADGPDTALPVGGGLW